MVQLKDGMNCWTAYKGEVGDGGREGGGGRVALSF